MMLCTSIHAMCILIAICGIVLSMNLNLKKTMEPSKRRSYFLSLVFITKCLTKNLLLRCYVNKNLSVKPLSSTWIISVFITICSLEIV